MLHGGLTLGDVQPVEVNFPDVPAALANGAIAGGLLGEPLTTLAEDRGQIHVLSEDFINNVQVTAVYFGGDFIRRHTDHAIGFMAAWLRACRDLAGPGFRQPEVGRIVQKYTGVPADIVVRARRPYYEPNGKMNLNDFVRLEQFFRTRGELTYTRPLLPAAYVDTTFVRRALAIVGPYAGPE
jgi:NitT/TauT family transport system substrate-binding protein